MEIDFDDDISYEIDRIVALFKEDLKQRIICSIQINELNAVREHAFKQGYEKGRERGLEEGIQEGKMFLTLKEQQ